MPPQQNNYKASVPSQDSSPQDQKKKIIHAKTGRVNYTTLEDVPEGTQVMAGMFSIDHCPATVLFDSGHPIPLSVKHVWLDINYE